MTVVMATYGYPEDYEKSTPINNLENLTLTTDDYLFHAGTMFKENKWLSNGGRVLNISSTGKDLKTIRETIQNIINQINGMRDIIEKILVGDILMSNFF